MFFKLVQFAIIGPSKFLCRRSQSTAIERIQSRWSCLWGSNNVMSTDIFRICHVEKFLVCVFVSLSTTLTFWKTSCAIHGLQRYFHKSEILRRLCVIWYLRRLLHLILFICLWTETIKSLIFFFFSSSDVNECAGQKSTGTSNRYVFVYLQGRVSWS